MRAYAWDGILGGSWVVLSRAIILASMHMTLFRVLITLQYL